MEPFLGQILQVGFNYAPRGWQFCNGQILSIAQNTALFSLLGTSYGGNGQTTFAVPDARGRVFLGWNQGTSNPPPGNFVLGQIGGTPSETLTLSNMPIHNHAATFTPSGGGSITGVLQARTGVAPADLSSTPAAGSMLANTADLEAGAIPLIYAPATAGSGAVNLAGLTISGTGGGGTVTVANNGSSTPINLMQPYQAVSVIIAVEGIFPSRN